MAILPDSPCDALKSPPFIGLPTPASKACEAAGSVTGGPANKLNDVAAKDDHKTLSALLIEAGFVQGHPTKEGDPDEVAVGLGIIQAESGGDPSVCNSAPCSNKGDHACGLMQICTPMHMSEADAKDPRKNLRKAHELYVSAGNSFARDWPTYHKGISGPDKTITVGKNTLTSEVVDAVPGLGTVTDLIAALFNPSTYLRVGKGVLGGVLIIIGVGAVAAIALKPVAKVAAGVVNPAAKLTRVAGTAAKIGRPAA